MDILHGGFIATLIDNLYGYLATLGNNFTPVVTKNINLKYLKPLKIG